MRPRLPIAKPYDLAGMVKKMEMTEDDLIAEAVLRALARELGVERSKMEFGVLDAVEDTPYTTIWAIETPEGTVQVDVYPDGRIALYREGAAEKQLYEMRLHPVGTVEPTK